MVERTWWEIELQLFASVWSLAVVTVEDELRLGYTGSTAAPGCF